MNDKDNEDAAVPATDAVPLSPLTPFKGPNVKTVVIATSFNVLVMPFDGMPLLVLQVDHPDHGSMFFALARGTASILSSMLEQMLVHQHKLLNPLPAADTPPAADRLN